MSKLQDIKCSNSDVISLSVQYISDTPPAISWKYEGKEVTENENMIISSEKGVALLRIKCACCKDSGRYSVRLENKHGSVESKCQLIVTGMYALVLFCRLTDFKNYIQYLILNLHS